MPRSIWRINISSEKEDNAKKVLNSIIKTIGRPPVESKIEKYSKGGHMATMQFYHSDNLSWPEVVYEVIEFSENLGSGWLLLGNVGDDPSGVLSNEGESRFSMSGISWAEWQVIRE